MACWRPIVELRATTMRLLSTALLSVVGLSPGWCAGEGAASRPQPLFSFAHITDTHLHDAAWIADQKARGVANGYRNYHTTPAKFRRGVEWIGSREDLAFMVLTGDIVEKATPERYAALAAAMHGIRTPWFVVPGNHDYRLERLLPGDLSHGGIDFSFSWAGFHFIGFPTFNPPGMSHVVGKESMAKLAQFLESHRADPVILLCHSPLVTAEGRTDSWEVPDNTVQVLQVLARCGNVVAALCGHNHGFWTCVKDGTLHASGPGFCQAPGAPTYAFLVWHVYADRMAAQVYYVNAEDQVVCAPELGVTHQWRSPARREQAERLAPRPATALPAPSSPILEKWYGLDWMYAPGYALPPSWREDVVLLPGQRAKAAVQIEVPRDQLPAPDAQGHDWQSPDYTSGEAWQTCTAPARYWDHTRPRGGHRHLFFRVAFDCKPAILKRLRRCAVKLMQYRSPQLFINGTQVWMPGGNMHAERWNGRAVIAPQLLRPEGNVLACRLTTSGWGGYQFDVEVSGELRD